jgi:acetyl esterase/lipase
MFDVRVQPWKNIYLLYAVTSTLVFWLPIWILASISPLSRPNSKWSFKRCILVRIQARIAYVDARVLGFGQQPNSTSLVATSEAKGIWIDPVPDLLVGSVKTWATTSHVDAVRIPAYWYIRPKEEEMADRQAKPGEKVILAFHGGGYIARSAHPSDPTAATPKGILAHAPSFVRILSVEYRLSSNVAGRAPNPFPAALLDALAAYNYLVNHAGFGTNDIILQGNSAGANLALALARYLIENRQLLASATSKSHGMPLLPPGGLILAAPYADVGSSHARPPQSWLYRQDWIHPFFSLGTDTFFVGPHSASTNPYISPASKSLEQVPSFVGWPRTLLVWSRDEDLADSIRTLRNRMCADMGEGDGLGQVQCWEEPDAVHDFASIPWHEPEYTRTSKTIAAWIASPS